MIKLVAKKIPFMFENKKYLFKFIFYLFNRLIRIPYFNKYYKPGRE